MKENKPDGAGCLPIAEHNNIKYLLLHTKTKDFGGAINDNEDIIHCACREFNEETFGFFFHDLNFFEKLDQDFHKVENSEIIIEATNKMIENWDQNSKHYICRSYHFFMTHLPFLDLTKINKIANLYDKNLIWVKLDDVLQNFDKLFIRLRIQELEKDLKLLQN